jgi:hypothetical protein
MEDSTSMERVKFNTVKDAARAWVVAAAHYSRLGGRPCKFTRSVGGACHAAGLSIEDMTKEFKRAMSRELTPYIMGWIAHVLWTDWSAKLEDHQLPKRMLGQFDDSPEYQLGWEDAKRASAILLSLAPDAEWEGPSVEEIEEQLRKAGY